jgi:hypothetical protein
MKMDVTVGIVSALVSVLMIAVVVMLKSFHVCLLSRDLTRNPAVEVPIETAIRGITLQHIGTPVEFRENRRI